MSDAFVRGRSAAAGRTIRRTPRVLAMLVAFVAVAVSARDAHAQKANGEVCFLPSECASGRCVVTCQPQIRTDTVAANASTVCFAGAQQCELPTDGSLLRDEYFASQIPPKFLDVAPPSTQQYVGRSMAAPPGPARADGSACILPGECASSRCLFFQCRPQSPPMPKKADGAGCGLPDECASGRCDFFTCKAQPAKKADGAACFLPGECASGSCNLFKCRAPAACEPPEPARPATVSPPANHFDALWTSVGLNEGRLRSDLRDAAREKNPSRCALPLAAVHYGLGGLDGIALGKAFADLSVTGKAAFLAFSASPPDERYCRSMPAIVEKISPSCGRPAVVPGERALVAGCLEALTRAYRVANFLRSGQALPIEEKRELRNRLGWIAVSGEDDSPHRPVNVPSSNYPQFDVDVSVKNADGDAITVRSRYIIGQDVPAARRPAPPNLALAKEPTASIPADAEVLLFLHGMDSRAEEATDITEQLLMLRRNAPGAKKLVMISVDLPTSGYADNLDHLRISSLETIGTPKDQLGNPVAYTLAAKSMIAAPDFSFTGETPLLDFLENFVVAFVETLDSGALPGLKGRMKTVMGGSLGGNLTFRLGRRCLSTRVGPCGPGEASNMEWLPNFIVWSPASIWSSFGGSPGFALNVDWDRLLDGNFKEAWQNFVQGSNFDPTGVTRHLAPLTALLSANDIEPGDPGDLLSPRRTALRREFFGSWDKPIVPILVNMSQSDSWQSEHYPCKKSALVAARLDRHETYDPLFLRWHWRLGAEQLLYSHQSNDANTPGQARYLSNTKPMLLACGTEDRILFNDICGATQRTVPYMSETPGKALFLQETGHSVDIERREYFARQIIQFLDGGAQPAPKKPDGAACFLPDECQSNRCQFFKCEAQPPPAVKKPDGAACFLPDECLSNRCQVFKCEAQPPPAVKKPDGAACFLPDECQSNRCQFFKCR
ncbi:MAG: hypothetical protein M3R55_11670 [Acidobacteriota bacterium]|nr:hypothetical protein [Acidobacteriota bacterium]